ncbi:hypothetical protein L210DRAFT_3411780 [Boletus edulis BED1]|uniref:Uncharacterized protein n=1 Tax=Boletus edulis BED1 TaxID=1328754 RepID=A0AAD4BL44_BOLED|nr:hypothetical protein L210DRAFT_3411780 [Boletus edulis BED1]
MSSFNYAAAPQSPTFGFFPTAPSAPHAFSALHGDPRDSHAMYAALGSAMRMQSSSSQSHNGGGSFNPLKKLCRK